MKKNLVVWMPLPPGSSWRGEGIAQTVEHVLKNFDQSIESTIVVSSHHYGDVLESFKEHKNIHVKPLTPVRVKYLKEERVSAFTNLELYQKALFGNLTFFKKIRNKVMRLNWIFLLFINSVVTHYNFGNKVIWVPTPIIPFTRLLPKNIFCSFWDPFVFEYSSFKDVQKLLRYKIYSALNNSIHIITQSNVNKEFLDAFFLKDKKVTVINNGSPDYSGYISELTLKTRASKVLIDDQFRVEVLGLFPETPKNRCRNKLDVAEIISRDHDTKSKLFRLRHASTKKPKKIIIMSTQSRPYKGIELFYSFLEHLNANSKFSWFVVTTSAIPKAITSKFPWIESYVFDIQRVTNEQHAFLYMISDLVIHPSFVEGGLGSYPQFEGQSLFVPSLTNIGRHTKEMEEKFSINGSNIFFDLHNFEDASAKCELLVSNCDAVSDNINKTKEFRVDWKDVSSLYWELFANA